MHQTTEAAVPATQNARSSSPATAAIPSGKYLKWPLALFDAGTARLNAHGTYGHVNRYSLHMIRYWFAACTVHEMRDRVSNEMVVLDMGMGRGHSRRFCPDTPNTRWIGMDYNAGRVEELKSVYDETQCLNFDNPLPLADASVDVVVFLHVIEHLLNPDFALAEIARILKPGGVLAGASPVYPAFYAPMHEKAYRRELASGKRKPGMHCNAYSPGRWKRSLKANNLGCELCVGGHLLCWRKNPLDNAAWWIRLNQLWGKAVPSLGAEIFVVGRKS